MNQRQNGILEMLISTPAATVLEISDQFNVSQVTVRSDLNYLEKLGRVTRTRGGARLAGERVRQEYSFATRQRINASQKYKIGKLAAGLINPMESILLDSSTTAVAVAQAVMNSRISLSSRPDCGQRLKFWPVRVLMYC